MAAPMRDGSWPEEWATQKRQAVMDHVARHWPESAENPGALERATVIMHQARENNNPARYMQGLRTYAQIASHDARRIRQRRLREKYRAKRSTT